MIRMILIVLAFLVFTAPASANHRGMTRTFEIYCSSSASMKSLLKSKYGEYPVVSGVTKSTRLAMVVYANEATGTWSVILFTPTGVACGLASGINLNRFKKRKPAPKGKPS